MNIRAHVGDEIVIDSAEIGHLPRKGEVIEVLSRGLETEHYRVRWDDGHESVFFPGSTTHAVRPGVSHS